MTIIPLLLLRARRKQQRRLKKAKQQRKQRLLNQQEAELDELVDDANFDEVSLDVSPAARASRDATTAPRASGQRKTIRLRDLTQSSYVLCIAGTVAVFILATTLVEYQWKVVAASTCNVMPINWLGTSGLLRDRCIL